MTVEFSVNRTTNGDSGEWWQSSRLIETGQKRSIHGTFVVYGTFDGATVKLQALIAGNWFDVTNASMTAAGLVTIEVFADAIRADQSGSGAGTVVTAAFETTEKLVDDRKLATFVYN